MSHAAVVKTQLGCLVLRVSVFSRLQHTRSFKLGTRRILQLERSGTLVEDEESISEEAS
jgi:hypothetical protein